MTGRWLWRAAGILAIIAGIAIIALFKWGLDQHEICKQMFGMFLPPQENPALVRRATIAFILGGALSIGGLAMLAWSSRKTATKPNA